MGGRLDEIMRRARARARNTLDKPIRDYTGRDVIRAWAWIAVIWAVITVLGTVLVIAVPGCFALAWLRCM